jgi:hypothetical protein
MNLKTWTETQLGDPKRRGHHKDIIYYAVNSVLNERRTARNVARELNVSNGTVSRWCGQAKDGTLDLGTYLTRYPKSAYHPAFFGETPWGTEIDDGIAARVAEFDIDDWYSKHGYGS